MYLNINVLEIDECEEEGNDNCQHKSQCEDHVNRYECICTPGYNGANCQTGEQRHLVIYCLSCKKV